MTKRALVVRSVTVVGLLLLLLASVQLLLTWQAVYRMGTTVRLKHKAGEMALFVDTFREREGRYPTNLMDMASEAGYRTEVIREWARKQITNSDGDRYEIFPDDDGFSVIMLRPRRFLLPSVMVSNRVSKGEAEYLFDPRSRRRDSGGRDRPEGEMESVDE